VPSNGLKILLHIIQFHAAYNWAQKFATWCGDLRASGDVTLTQDVLTSSPECGFAMLPRKSRRRKVMKNCVGSGSMFGVLGVAVSCLVTPPARAADFYAGKTINFIIGSDAAGGYDTYARAIARHLSRFIPGTPVIVSQNMPGAGSGKAAAYLYNLAPKDGTTVGALFPGVIIDPLLQKRAVNQFDATKFNYLASAASNPRVCMTGPASKITTFAQALTENIVLGATQNGGSTNDYAYMIKNATGAKFDIVSGYKGTATIMLAIESGEVEGVCGIDWSSLKSLRPQWLRDKTAHLLVEEAPEPNAELTALNVPNIESFIKGDLDRQAVSLIISQQVFSRPYVAPPGVPEQQAKILRNAFAAALRDAQFLLDAKSAHLDIDPASAEKVQQTVARLYDASGEVVQRARQLIASPEEQR
jgi:tripartite-type tricarboxylate transporter receptor subunit TctC